MAVRVRQASRLPCLITANPRQARRLSYQGFPKTYMHPGAARLAAQVPEPIGRAIEVLAVENSTRRPISLGPLYMGPTREPKPYVLGLAAVVAPLPR